MPISTPSELILLPRPRFLTFTGGSFTLPDQGEILFEGVSESTAGLTGVKLLEALSGAENEGWKVLYAEQLESENASISLHQLPDSDIPDQGYGLVITAERISVTASSISGLFYAAQTLVQLLQQSEGDLPCLHIEDWPDFPRRGVMLDISRDKVPTMETLFGLVDLLASWKINEFQLYTEHTFAYQKHRVVWENASPMTAKEIQALDEYCRQQFVDLVPNQNSFGHMRRWLIHDEYKHLAECPQGCKTLWGYFDEPFSLSPSVPETLDFLAGLYDELLPNFGSGYFNVGCDETVDLGQGRSADLVAEKGAGRVYLDFLLKILDLVSARGRTMQFWGDIVRQYPKLVPELPRDLAALEWGYEEQHDFDQNGALFASAGIPFYVCPGTSSWNSVAGRTDNALGNLLNAAENGLKHGAIGYLNTDWGDEGHWQPLPVSYLGYAFGAAVSWALDANSDVDLRSALDAFAFKDSANGMGSVAFDLGNVYQSCQLQPPNRTILFQVLQTEIRDLGSLVCPDGDLDQALRRFQSSLDLIDKATAPLEHSAAAPLVLDEYSWVADMLRHACWRSLYWLQHAQGKQDKSLLQRLRTDAVSLLERHEVIWHTRNRPGGFADSQWRLRKMAADYDAL